jgi:hypothetical protein
MLQISRKKKLFVKNYLIDIDYHPIPTYKCFLFGSRIGTTDE